MEKFNGQKVIVTGATRGIGRAISESFLKGGATLIGLYSSNDAAAEQMSSDCRSQGYQVELHRCDVSDHEAVKSFFEDIEERFGTIDVLVNNAGIRKDALTPLMAFADWQQVIDINLTGTFNMSKHAVPLMLKQKYGRIINITSPVSHLGFQGQANYGASKAGQIGLSRTLAKEVARKKITVNCVSPGFIKTNFIDDLSDDQLATYKKMVPMRRFGTVEEVADTVLFLASSRSSYITGAVIDITGGL
jgi:3-oxoacyl-[acyl-carrier protein] reductase